MGMHIKYNTSTSITFSFIFDFSVRVDVNKRYSGRQNGSPTWTDMDRGRVTQVHTRTIPAGNSLIYSFHFIRKETFLKASNSLHKGTCMEWPLRPFSGRGKAKYLSSIVLYKVLFFPMMRLGVHYIVGCALI